MAPTTTDAVLAFVAAAAIAWLLVPYAERLAFRVGAIDLPEGARPARPADAAPLRPGDPGRGRGRRLDLAARATARAARSCSAPWRSPRSASSTTSTACRRCPKLLGQIAAASIPVLAGVRVDNLTLPFVGGFELGWLAYPLTVLGIVAVVNVINFLDGVDGLAAGVCTIAAITLAAIALSLERNAAGVLAALTAGAALGFLRHGFPPASSFMGDTGSNLLGYLLGDRLGPGGAEDERRDRPRLPADRARGADPRHRLRRRQAAQIPPADLPGRQLALPPPDGQHRLLASAARVAYLYAWTLVMAGAGAGPALRPLQRQPRPLRRPLDGGDGRLRSSLALASSVYLVYVLEILKLRRGRINPETGEFEAIELRGRQSRR